MTDRGKMVNELTYQLHSKEVTKMYHPVQLSVTDAKKILELLKEHEPVKPIDQGDDSYVCENCGETVGWEELDVFGIDPVKYKFCPGCGRRVKWE